MTRAGRRLIEDFLLPALNDQRYGDRLQWVDKTKLYFSIRWSHKNASKWTLEDTLVFQEWDKLKGHFHPEVKGYHMQAKQRFRAALYKLNTIKKLRSEEKHIKIYQLVLNNDKKKSSDLPAIKSKPAKESTCIPTPVICRNYNYVPPSNQSSNDQWEFKPSIVEKNSDSMSNDSFSVSSDMSHPNVSVSSHSDETETTLLSEPEVTQESSSTDDKIRNNDSPVVKEEESNSEWKDRKIPRHIPVQTIPHYVTWQAIRRSYQSEPISSPSQDHKLNQSEYSLKVKEEPMECEALNLSVKQPTLIPVSAR